MAKKLDPYIVNQKIVKQTNNVGKYRLQVFDYYDTWPLDVPPPAFWKHELVYSVSVQIDGFWFYVPVPPASIAKAGHLMVNELRASSDTCNP